MKDVMPSQADEERDDHPYATFCFWREKICFSMALSKMISDLISDICCNISCALIHVSYAMLIRTGQERLIRS